MLKNIERSADNVILDSSSLNTLIMSFRLIDNTSPIISLTSIEVASPLKIPSNEDVTSPLYRNFSGYRAEYDYKKIRKLTVHYYID